MYSVNLEVEESLAPDIQRLMDSPHFVVMFTDNPDATHAAQRVARGESGSPPELIVIEAGNACTDRD